MNKKRKPNNSSESFQTQTKKPRNNPFLPGDDESGNYDSTRDEAEDLLAQSLEFLNAEKYQHHDKTNEKRAFQSVGRLVKFLEREIGDNVPAATTQNIVTRTATIVLPFTAKRLLQPCKTYSTATINTLWKSLRLCLKTLAEIREKNGRGAIAQQMENVLAQALPTKTLVKLVPLAARVALTMNEPSPAECDAKGSYRILVNGVFSPSLEVAFHSLFLEIIEDFVCSAPQGGSVTRSDGDSIMSMTLRLLEHLLEKANPKTAFQILSMEKSLVAFSRVFSVCQNHPHVEAANECCNMIQKILWDGLFDSGQHLDAYRSIAQLRTSPSFDRAESEPRPTIAEDESPSKKSSFNCYQETLIMSLQQPALAATSSGIDSAEAIFVTKLVPLLFEGFLIKLFGNKKKKKLATKKKGSTNLEAQIQFFFFANAIVPIWNWAIQSELQSEASVHCLNALSKCLKLLLQNDASAPSDIESNPRRKQLLVTLTKEVLGSACEIKHSSQYLCESLETLLRFDHRLVNDQLEDVLLFCIIHQRHWTGLSENYARNLFVSTIQSYQQLRQFNVALFAALRVVKNSLKGNCEVDLGAFKSLVSHPSVHQALGNAMKENPSFKVKELFNQLSEWINNLVTQQHGADRVNKALTVVIQDIAVCLLRNAFVDKNTSLEIASICEEMMNGPVLILCKNSHEASVKGVQNIVPGVILCASILDLQMRCSFWLGHEFIEQNEVKAPLPPLVKKLLESPRDGNPIGNIEEIFDYLLHLARFRLRQLDYLIREKTLGESDELKVRDKREDEARRLAKSIVQLSECSKLSGSDWQHVAQVINSWAPYADSNHLKRFLMWMFRSLSGAYDTGHGSITGLPGKHCVQSTNHDEERATALALIHDASFFEIDEISELFTLSGLACITCLVDEAKSACLKFRTSSGKIDSGAKRLSNLNHDKLAIASTEAILRFVKPNEEEVSSLLMNTLPGSAITLLQGALRIVQVLNGIRATHSSSIVSRDCAVSAFRLESVSRQLLHAFPSEALLLVKLVSSLRVLTANKLILAGSLGLSLLPNTAPSIEDILNGVLVGSVLSGDVRSSCNVKSYHRFLFATEKMVRAMVEHYLENSERAVFFVALRKIVNSFCSNGERRSKNEAILFFAFSKQIADALKGGDVQRELLKAWIKAISEKEDGEGGPLYRSYRCLCAGSLFLWVSSTPTNIDATTTDQRDMLAKIADTHMELPKQEMEGAGAGMYLLLCYAQVGPQIHKQQELLSRLLDSEVEENPWLEATICSLIRETDGEQLKSSMVKLTRKVLAGSEVGLRVCAALFQEMKNETQIYVMSKYAKEILHKAVETMHVQQNDMLGNRSKRIATATSLVTNLVQNKRLLSVKEREIALLLAQTSALLGCPKRAVAFFPFCYTLFGTLVQRFPRQTYVCVSSVVLLLHSFERHILYDEMDGETVRERSQLFSRLCELLVPHKDVYKKHVVWLLLEFANGLGRGISVLRKECCLPAVFYLLDMLTKYEFQQLNILMDTMARTLFRSIHQSYKKLHEYKGY